MPVVGVTVGLYLANISLDREVAAIRAKSPDESICGLIVIPFLFIGLLGGLLGGMVAGGIVREVVTWFMRKREDGDKI